MGNSISELFNSLKRNPDNKFFMDLIHLLEFRLSTVQDQIVRSVEDNETKRLQGRALELMDMLSALQRKPVKPQSTGAFS